MTVIGGSVDAREWAQIDRLIDDVVDRKMLSGAAVLAWKDGLVHEAAIGLRDMATRSAMSVDTIFRLYSMTKPVTAAAMMILWDEGRWKPDDLLSDHLPELSSLRVAGPDGRTVDLHTPITIEHVMTHQAGFGYGLLAEPIDDLFRSAGVPSFPYDMEPADYLERLATVPLAFQPGAGWRYSAAMDVQGLLVEKLSAQRYADFLQERIFGPLGMRDTGFTVPDANRDRFATLYTLLPDDNLLEVTGSADRTGSPAATSDGFRGCWVGFDRERLSPLRPYAPGAGRAGRREGVERGRGAHDDVQSHARSSLNGGFRHRTTRAACRI